MKKDNSIRIGRISSINYAKGLVRVIYSDKDKAVTKELPVLSLNGEYKMPKVDAMVLVLHLSNGSSMGIVLGTFWNDKNVPAESGSGIYRKEFSNTSGEAFMRYDELTKALTIYAGTIKLITDQNTTIF